MKIILDIFLAVFRPLIGLGLSFFLGRGDKEKEQLKDAEKANKTRNKIRTDSKYRDKIRRMFSNDK